MLMQRPEEGFPESCACVEATIIAVPCVNHQAAVVQAEYLARPWKVVTCPKPAPSDGLACGRQAERARCLDLLHHLDPHCSTACSPRRIKPTLRT